MKKFLLLTTFLSFVYYIQAQSGDNNGNSGSESNIRLGLQFTPTIGFMKSDKNFIKGGGLSLGYNFGLTGDFKFADNYFFNTGIDIIFSPVKLNYLDTLRDPKLNTNDVILHYKLRYLGIPLSLKLKTNLIKKMRFYGQFGVEPQFNISKKVKPDKGFYAGPDYWAPAETQFSNFDDDIKFVRLALLLGAGFEYPIGGKTSVVGGIGFNAGFTDINKENASKITNNYISLNLGVLF